MSRPAATDQPALDSAAPVFIYDGHRKIGGFYSHEFLRRLTDQGLEIRRKNAQLQAISLVSSSGETGCDGHVGDSTQSPSAQAVQELADSFSDQLPGRIRDKGKSPAGVLVEKDLVSYRHDWEKYWGHKFGSFEFYTCVRAMLFTCKRTPPYAGVKTCLQIFSIRVMEISDGHLEWPLEVYGLVAIRDSVDHNRNMIFRREREACQLLNQQDSFLTLTGPSRAIVFTGPVDVEIQLKVKGGTIKPEDTDLISEVLVYGRYSSDNFTHAGIGNHNLMRTSCSSELCSLQVTSAVLNGAVEATVISAEVIEGRWNPKSGIRVVSGTASIDEDIVLLDARDRRFRVDLAGGVIALARNVVCVEKDGRLKLCVEAYRKSGHVYAKSGVTELIPKSSSASTGICELPFCTVEFTVGWSCLVSKVDDLMTYGI